MKRPQWKSTRVVCHLKLQKSKKWKHVTKVYDGITYDECQYSVCGDQRFVNFMICHFQWNWLPSEKVHA